MLELYTPTLVWALPTLVGTDALALLFTYLTRWRHDTLAAKYVAWQTEAQDVEKATHAAIYNQPQNEKPVYPRVSIVVAAQNQARQLEYLLPKLLEQQYKGKFEVVVVDQVSTDDTEEVLKRLELSYSHLRHSFVPPHSRHIELRKLALTIGIKAARSEWVIVVNPDTVPVDSQWLQHYAENLLPGVDWVQAYLNYDDDGSDTARRAILDRVRLQNLRLQAYENGVILGCDTANYAIRKTWFLQNQGFADSLQIPFGEESLLAYFHTDAERTTFLCSPDTRLTEEVPGSAQMKCNRIQMAELARRMKGVGRTYFARAFATSWFIYLYILLTTIYIGLRVWIDIDAGVYQMCYLYTDVVMLLLFLLAGFLPQWGLRKSMKALGERKIKGYVYFYDLLQPWRTLAAHIARRKN